VATIYWRPGGKRWRPGASAYLNWREGGRQIRRSLGAIDPAEAEAIRAKKEAELEHGVKILPRAPRVRDFMDYYLDWYEATHPTTAKKAKSEAKRFLERFGHRPIDSLKPVELETYKRDRLRLDKAAPETVGKEIRRLHAAFQRGVEWHELDANPLSGIKAPRGARSVAVRFYTQDQLKALYAARSDERAALWRFMANTGLRRGEVARVRKSDVQRGRLMIESIPDEDGHGRTKSGQWREVPLNAAAREALAALPDPIVSVHADTLSHWFAQDARAAGIGGTLHRLRHTFCAHLAMAGVPLRRIQILAGHSDYKITERYAHLAPEGEDGAVSRIDL
jgi:integrase